jgi:quercetin dioxygenase-like cupin family protein
MRVLLLCVFPFFIQGQINWQKKDLPKFENLFIEKIAEDSLQSTFFIAIKKQVIHHYHKEHSECIVVLSGKGEMTVGEQKVILKHGVQINIPKNTIHAVTVTSKKPLRVISIQSPMFDGKDRHFP